MTYHGIIPVWKPAGLTSHDIVGKIRRLAGQKRVGHTGTLDPAVEGVLPICLGQATRVVEYIQDLPKRYRGTMTLGIATDTEDQTGEVIAMNPVHETSFPLAQVVERFQGEIEQVPPMYSAVKVAGKRLYDLARQGKEVQRAPRKVTIYQLLLQQLTDGEFPQFAFDVTCSKGTYVRTLCVDIGKALGYPAHMSKLTRVQSGPFQAEDCYPLSKLTFASEQGEFAQTLVNLDEALGHLPALVVDETIAKQVLDGNVFTWDEEIPSGLVRIYDEIGNFCAIYRVEKQEIIPVKVFRDVHQR
jgi:tRNA pseudouridine55 synthase